MLRIQIEEYYKKFFNSRENCDQYRKIYWHFSPNFLNSLLHSDNKIEEKRETFYGLVLPVFAGRLTINDVPIWPCLFRACKLLHRNFENEAKFQLHLIACHSACLPGYGTCLVINPLSVRVWCFGCKRVYRLPEFEEHREFNMNLCSKSSFIIRRNDINGKLFMIKKVIMLMIIIN